MKMSRELKAEGRGPESCTLRAANSGTRPSTFDPRWPRNAFTLIEVMVVVGIMGIILAMGIPSIYKLMSKEGMRKATSDVEDVCRNARARAIFTGTPMDVIFHPLERRLEVGGGGGGGSPLPEAGGGAVAERSSSPASSSSGAQIDEDITIEMLDINLSEYKDSEWARVRFYPNGTSDEMTLVLRSSKNEWKKVTLEVTTGFTSVDNVQ
jgi:prepilin-type N-terminal cleavage/methylation domain-containing protein